MSRERIKQLREQLDLYNYQYYVLDNPSVSDSVYDSLMKELVALEKQFSDYDPTSPSQRVGGAASNNFAKVIHDVPMLSLANAFGKEDLIAFDSAVRKATGLRQVDYTCELKIDGLSISIHYEDGQFVKAATRGNGEVGEDVSENVKTIKSIPLKISLKDKIEVRGEVFMPKSVFAALNKERITNGEAPFANPRNAAAGSLRQIDPKLVAKRRLDSFLYYLLIDKKRIKQDEALASMQKMGFKVNPEYRLCKSINDVLAYIAAVSARRYELDYEIDGVVIKVADSSLYDIIGQTAKTPKWAAAYKFPPEETVSRLLKVALNVGRSGKITPVALIEPTYLAGSTISKITLNNFAFIKEKDIRFHDQLVIRKAGDVIPEVVASVKEGRTARNKEIVPPIDCPKCGSQLLKNQEAVEYFCPNSSCPARIVQSLVYYVSRGALNIEGIGDKLIPVLYEKGFLTSIADFYLLRHKKEQLEALEGMGEKSVATILKNIEDSKELPLWRLLSGIGIPEIGEKSARALARRFSNIDNLMNAKPEEIMELYNFGEILARNTVAFFKNKANQELIFKLKMLGVNTEEPELESYQPLLGKTVVVTGSFEKYGRKELTVLLEQIGARVAGAVSRNTAIVFVGENPGSKLQDAQKLGVKTMYKDDLEKLLGDR